MNAAQIHLLLNHLPVIIPLIALPILAIGLFVQSSEVQKVSLWLFIVSAILAAPTYLTGQPAEQFLKNYPGVSRLAIHHHEDAAQIALIGIEGVGALSIVLLLLVFSKATPSRVVKRTLWTAHFILAITSLILLMRASHLGGEIRHEEIQSDRFLQAT